MQFLHTSQTRSLRGYRVALIRDMMLTALTDRVSIKYVKLEFSRKLVNNCFICLDTQMQLNKHINTQTACRELEFICMYLIVK